MTRTMKKIATRGVPLGLLFAATVASAQIATNPLPVGATPSGVYGAFPTQNLYGPQGAALQTNYPYPGQCLASTALAVKALFPLTATSCTATGSSFAKEPVGQRSQRSAGDWAAAGVVTTFTALNPIVPNSLAVAPAVKTPKFAWNVLNPPEYAPDTTTYPGADYYEIGLHEAWGFDGLAKAGLFPNPGVKVPNGMQWTGLVCQPIAPATTCSCPADASDTFKATYCPGGAIAAGDPLFTPIWGVGQINNGGGPVTQTLKFLGLFKPVAGDATEWSLNNYVATWPSISIRANRGRPVVVKWVNEFPNNHVLCPHPEAADWPCAIDRTFMGVKATIDPALAPNGLPEGVNRFGSPQQPDNSWVTHLHGGEIPPSTDGFAEKWFGNAKTAPYYAGKAVNPPFENPSFIGLKRPDGNADTYTYPMVQEEATIWFHDHTLGKTHHNVIAGPAGFFPVKEPAKHGGVGTGANKCPIDPSSNPPAPFASCSTTYTWLDPVTEPRNDLGQPLYDLFLAIQDRSFNDDGSINFSNTLGQTVPVAPKRFPNPIGWSTVTAGVNPRVHPVWVPEYFGDHALVNGVLWPKAPVVPGWYRMRIVDGSDSRCYTLGFMAQAVAALAPAPGTKVTNNVPFYVIANDQGYLKNPVLAPGNQFTMCPGERYEVLVNFGALPVAGDAAVYMTNSAPAPFPAGITPYANASPYAELNVLMRFDVSPTNANRPLDVSTLLGNPKGTNVLQLGGAPVRTCAGAANWDPNWTQAQIQAALTANSACMPLNPALQLDPNYVNIRPVAWPLAGAAGTPIPFQDGVSKIPIVRQVYLNERVDGVTLAPMGMQLNGVPFEYKVTETPKQGSREIWQFVNLTVDAHPMHPHLVSHQIVARQTFNVGQYKALLCGSTTCQPGTAPGGEMQVVPDVTPLLSGGPALVNPGSVEGGRKDATQVPPGMVTTIVADWTARFNLDFTTNTPTVINTCIYNDPQKGWQPPGCKNVSAPGAANQTNGSNGSGGASTWIYEDVTAGPYVWHCHINSHEDSEMMRTSLVVK